MKESKHKTERRAIQKHIIDTYPPELIEQKVRELCGDCVDQNRCFLLPITSDGKDCPYHRRKDVLQS